MKGIYAEEWQGSSSLLRGHPMTEYCWSVEGERSWGREPSQEANKARIRVDRCEQVATRTEPKASES
jgi:hypothetical protein